MKAHWARSTKPNDTYLSLNLIEKKSSQVKSTAFLSFPYLSSKLPERWSIIDECFARSGLSAEGQTGPY